MPMPTLADWSLGTTIPAKDLDGTRRFYEDVLGAQVVTEDPGGIIYRAGDSYFSLYPTEFAGTAQRVLGRPGELGGIQAEVGVPGPVDDAPWVLGHDLGAQHVLIEPPGAIQVLGRDRRPQRPIGQCRHRHLCPLLPDAQRRPMSS